MRQWIGSALAQIMACCLFGAKPLSEPVLPGLLSIGPLGTKFSENCIKIHTFSCKKIHLKMSSAKQQPFCLGGDELMTSSMYYQVILDSVLTAPDCIFLILHKIPNALVIFLSPVGCHFNTIQFNNILYIILQWFKYSINQSLFSQKTPHITA